MNPQPEVETIHRTLTVTRLIVGALLSGVLIMAGGAAWWISNNPPDADASRTHVLLLGLVGVGVAAVVGLTVLRRVFIAQAQRMDLPPAGGNVDATLAAVAPTFQTWTLAQAALGEALGLLGVAVHVLTGHMGGLAGAALGAALLARARPSQDHLRRFTSDVVGRPL